MLLTSILTDIAITVFPFDLNLLTLIPTPLLTLILPLILTLIVLSLSLSPAAATASAALTAATRGALLLRSLAGAAAFRLGAAMRAAMHDARLSCLAVPCLRADFCPAACPALATFAAALNALSAAFASLSTVGSFSQLPRFFDAFLSPSFAGCCVAPMNRLQAIVVRTEFARRPRLQVARRAATEQAATLCATISCRFRCSLRRRLMFFGPRTYSAAVQ